MDTHDMNEYTGVMGDVARESGAACGTFRDAWIMLGAVVDIEATCATGTGIEATPGVGGDDRAAQSTGMDAGVTHGMGRDIGASQDILTVIEPPQK
jgi:hypothetical protein